jgi:hypothetical protein
MFSKNTKNAKKSQVMSVLNISTEAYNDKYLGLPKKQTFAYLKERVWKRIQGWKEKLFIKDQQRCPYQGNSTSYPNLCNVML